MKNKNLAKQLLQDHPEQNQVFITQDQQGFFNELDATNHASRNKLEAPEVFFREGHEPEDTQELEEALRSAQEENGTMKEALEQISLAVDLQKEAPEVTGETHSAVADVVILRECYENSRSELNETKGVLTTITSELETANIELETTKSELQTASANLETATSELEAVKTELEALKVSALEVVKEKESTGVDTSAKAKK